MPDDFDLERFVIAQDDDGVYERALGELRNGRKRTHWIWFVFPQLAGLGDSPLSVFFAIASLAEARAYLDHPVLGPRLLAGVQALLTGSERDALAIFGEIDAVKLRSSMTLFARAAEDPTPFTLLIDEFFDGIPDRKTEVLL